MKLQRTKTFLATAVLGIAASLTSCGKTIEDSHASHEPTMSGTSKVFPHGIPKIIASDTIHTDANGRVTAIRSEKTIITFEYPAPATSQPHIVMMKVKGRVLNEGYEEDEEDEEYKLYLNQDGFIDRGEVKVTGGGRESIDSIQMSYDESGHLIRAIMESGEKTWNWKYINGDIVEVTRLDRDPDGIDLRRWSIDYTSASVSTPIENKGHLMFYDHVIPADFDHLSYAYYAGLLGRATRHLPIHSKEFDDDGLEQYSWILNADNLPTSLTTRYTSDNYSSDSVSRIIW